MQKNNLHLGQPPLNAPILLYYSFTLLLFYYFACSRYSAAAADVWGWPPEMQKKIPCTTTHYQIYYVLPRTAAERSFCISDSHPCMSALLFYCFTILLFYYFTAGTVLPRLWPPEMQKNNLHLGQPPLHVGSPILLFCNFTILLFYYSTILLQIQYCRGRCLGMAARDANKFSFHVLPRTTAERSFCISDSHPCMSALLFYYSTILLFYCFAILRFYDFTILLFYHFTPDTVLPRPMFGVGSPRCKNSFCISDSHPCMSALLFYYLTILLLADMQKCRPTCRNGLPG